MTWVGPTFAGFRKTAWQTRYRFCHSEENLEWKREKRKRQKTGHTHRYYDIHPLISHLLQIHKLCEHHLPPPLQSNSQHPTWLKSPTALLPHWFITQYSHTTPAQSRPLCSQWDKPPWSHPPLCVPLFYYQLWPRTRSDLLQSVPWYELYREMMARNIQTIAVSVLRGAARRLLCYCSTILV